MKKKKRKYRRYTNEEKTQREFDKYFDRQNYYTKNILPVLTIIIGTIFFPLGMVIDKTNRKNNLIMAIEAVIIISFLVILTRSIYNYYKKKKRENIVKGIIIIEGLTGIEINILYINIIGIVTYYFILNKNNKLECPLMIFHPVIGLILLSILLIIILIMLNDKVQKKYIYEYFDEKNHIFKIQEYMYMPTPGIKKQFGMIEEGEIKVSKYKRIKDKLLAIMLKWFLPATPIIFGLVNTLSKIGNNFIHNFDIKVIIILFGTPFMIINGLHNLVVRILPLYYIIKHEKKYNVKVKCYWNILEEEFWKEVKEKERQKALRKQQRRLEREKKNK